MYFIGQRIPISVSRTEKINWSIKIDIQGYLMYQQSMGYTPLCSAKFGKEPWLPVGFTTSGNHPKMAGQQDTTIKIMQTAVGYKNVHMYLAML